MSYPNDLFATLVQAGTIATQALTLPNQLVESVYVDYDDGLAQFGETVNITIPTLNVSNATDITNGGITGIAPADSQVAVTLNHKYSSNRKIPDFDAVRANPIRLAALYIKPIIEEALQRVNISLAGLITAANFTTHGVVAASGDNLFTRADVAAAWAKLRTVGVPVRDGNMSLITHPVVYGTMMSNSEWANQSVQSMTRAEAVNRTGVLLTQYGIELKDDPHLGIISGGSYAGVLMHKYAIALRTAVMAPPQGTAMIQTVVYPKPDVPVHLQLWYESKDQAHYAHAFCLCGYALARENLAVMLSTT